MPSFTRLCLAAFFVPRALALLRQGLSASVHDDTVDEHHLSHAGPGLGSPENAIDEYLAQHGADAFRREFEADQTMICNRHFVSQVCTAPPRIGNEMGEFVNGFAFALVANRTFVLAEDTCSSYYLDFSERILRDSDVQEMTKQAGCKINFPSSVIKSGKPMAHQRIDVPDAWASQRHVTTRLWHQEVAHRVLENKELGAEAARRAQSLFGTSVLLGYNALFHAAWAFKDSVRALVDKTLRDQADVFKVGLHVRHSGLCRAGCRENVRAANCVKMVLNRSTSQNCVVLIATDFPEAEDDLTQQVTLTLLGGRQNSSLASVEQLNLEQTAKDIEAVTGCKVRSALATPKMVQTDNHEDHGPWAFFSSVADLYFLSRSDALVVGYSRTVGNSSYSERAAELFADGSASKALQVYDYQSSCGDAVATEQDRVAVPSGVLRVGQVLHPNGR